MGYTSEEMNIGLSQAISSTRNLYSDPAALNAEILSSLQASQIDPAVLGIYQNTMYNRNLVGANWGGAPMQDLLRETVKDSLQDFALSALQSRESLSLTINREVKLLVSATVSYEQALVAYFNSLPVLIYAEKITGTIVYTETVLSETTHIPIGKYIADLAKGIDKALVVASFKDAYAATYEAAQNPQDITLGLNALAKHLM